MRRSATELSVLKIATGWKCNALPSRRFGRLPDFLIINSIMCVGTELIANFVFGFQGKVPRNDKQSVSHFIVHFEVSVFIVTFCRAKRKQKYPSTVPSEDIFVL